MNEEKIEVPLQAIEDYEEIRKISTCNMMDSKGVFIQMLEHGMHETVGWLISDRWNGSKYRNPVDNKKYIALLHEYSEIHGLANYMKSNFK